MSSCYCSCENADACNSVIMIDAPAQKEVRKQFSKAVELVSQIDGRPDEEKCLPCYLHDLLGQRNAYNEEREKLKAVVDGVHADMLDLGAQLKDAEAAGERAANLAELYRTLSLDLAQVLTAVGGKRSGELFAEFVEHGRSGAEALRARLGELTVHTEAEAHAATAHHMADALAKIEAELASPTNDTLSDLRAIVRDLHTTLNKERHHGPQQNTEG